MNPTWNTHIQELTAEASEIITNIKACESLTWQQRDELIQIVFNDVADQAGLQKARELLYAWQ